MACDLTIGRKEPCKDVVGGIRAVYFLNYGVITAAFDSTDTDVVEDLGTVTAFEYEVKGNSSFEQTITASRENGTAFFEQTLNLTLHKLTVQDHKELKLLTYGRPHVVIQDYNDNAFIMGLEHGADVSGGTIVTGAAMGDMSGYTLTLTAQEVLPANFLEGATAANPFAGMTNTVTITQGTNS
ncbi:hypothetical protein [Phenylobacterium sp.]|jgi:hypothetical protein|uniref:hypothetical protein n=1 Tax=Phenylobacterium sp. TaxID=1871053 RepID=UPI0025DEDB99|nr:hypothetical protein [Phenylobacterium sp.]|tara:strand:+ start:1931 stop:2479 length:549 start_codon:yes stop_codon:yes gene_type:complete